MAKFELKFKAYDNDNFTIQTECIDDIIRIKLTTKNNVTSMFLDKSTAIKFAKTLRTEINKITESEGELG